MFAPTAATFFEWFQGSLCIGFPFWVMIVMMILVKYVKKPEYKNAPDKQNGFPIVPNESGNGGDKPTE